MTRTMIVNLEENKISKISGFVEKVRDTRYMVFIILKDITGKIQISIDKEKDANLVPDALKLIAGSVISVSGKMALNPNVKAGGKEFLPEALEILSLAEPSPIDGETNIDNRMNYRWIDLRSEKNTLIFQIGTVVEMAMREFSTQQNLIEIHTPKISGQSTEGGAEVFEVKYYDKKAYLTQSPQLYKQMAVASGFEKVFEIGPCYRAEKSFTARHATEFFAYDVEMGYIDSHHDVMDFEEELLKYVMKRVKDTYGEKIKEVFGVDIVVPEKMPRIKFADIMQILKDKYNQPIKDDLETETERMVCDYAKKEFGSEFVFITDYPTVSRAFYSMKAEDEKYTKSFDLLFKDGEITSGAQREHRPEVLKAQIAEKGINPDNMEDYIAFFKYGCPPHGGFAIGIARLLAKMLNLPSIKEASFLFRGPNRLNP